MGETTKSGRRRSVEILEAAGVLIFAGFFWLLPIDVASALGGALGRLIGPRLGLSRRALSNIATSFPENSDADNRHILRGMWDNLGRTAAEYPHLAQICAEKSGRVAVVNGRIVSALARDGQPGIIFGAHIANWEVGPYTLRRLLEVPLASVYRAPNNPFVDRIIRRFRRAPVELPKGGDGSRELVKLLRKGGHAGILLDQKLNDGIAVPFFGRDAMTAPGAARLALRFGCPLVPALAERLDGARFRVTAFPPLQITPSGDAAADVLTLMTQVNALFETWIRARPEQWLWLHRRWPD